jgi:predicted TIM-barrel fold metal-dependent hydrolase
MLIDCDVHPQLQRGESLIDYIPEAFRDRFVEGLGGSSASYPPPNSGRRIDSFPSNGQPSGSDPEMFAHQLFGDAGVDYAIHLCDVGGNSVDPSMDAAIKSGMNNWMARKWIGEYNQHGRYRSAITIGLADPALAVREIEKWAEHPYFVQLLGNPKVNLPFGNRVYHPIWEAAARHNLPFSIHKNSVGLPALQTPVGYCAVYPEIHSVAEATVYVAHALSFICEGVFDKYPDFKVVFVEGGFAWVGPLFWRLEKMWDAVRCEFPHIKRRPTDYLYENIRFTTQPIEEPKKRRDLIRLLDMIDAERVLMFATDYPHWDYDDPKRALARLSDSAMRKISHQNAAELYNMPTTPPPPLN